jgi:hypothetical protein
MSGMTDLDGGGNTCEVWQTRRISVVLIFPISTTEKIGRAYLLGGAKVQGNIKSPTLFHSLTIDRSLLDKRKKKERKRSTWHR